MSTTKPPSRSRRAVQPPPLQTPDDHEIVVIPTDETEIHPTIEQAVAIAETPTTQTPTPTVSKAPTGVVASAMDPLAEAAMLIERLNVVRADALRTGLATITEQISRLKTLGYEYTLTQTDQTAPVAIGARRGRPPGSTKKSAPTDGALAPKIPVTGPNVRYNPTKECQICGVVGHDGRAHRGQTTKKKFTPTEMAAYGVAPPKG